MNYENATKQIAVFVSHFFFDRVDPGYCFHHLQQTEYVVGAALRISKSFRLSKREIFLLTTAARFQNTGYYQGDTQHEERSCKLAAEFSNRNEIPPADIVDIGKLILSTKSSQQPEDVLEEILADANYYYFGCKSFTKWITGCTKNVNFCSQVIIYRRKPGKKKWFK